MNTYIKLLITNSLMVGISYFLWRSGYVTDALNNDILYIIHTIPVVALFGFIMLVYGNPLYKWASGATLTMGLMGTILGLQTIFSGIDPSSVGDTTQVAKVIGVLLKGTGQAFWTTLTGAYFFLWLTLNQNVLGRED